jgi:hypothetical protein
MSLSNAEIQGIGPGKLEFREAWQKPDILFNTAETTMAYRISYEDGSAVTIGAEGYGGATRSEYFAPNSKRLRGRAGCSAMATTMLSPCTTILAESSRAFCCN